MKSKNERINKIETTDNEVCNKRSYIASKYAHYSSWYEKRNAPYLI